MSLSLFSCLLALRGVVKEAGGIFRERIKKVRALESQTQQTSTSPDTVSDSSEAFRRNPES